MHDVQDAEMHSINMLVIAHPGEGKTPFWSTGGKRLLLMDADDGYESAKATGSRCVRMPVHDYDDLEDAYQYCSSKEGQRDFGWAVLDSITIFQERALIDDLMRDAVAQNPNQHEFVPSKREYGINHNRLGRYLRQFVALPMNFGVSAHVMIDSDPNDGSTMWIPAVQGKNMPGKVMGYMNVVAVLSQMPVLGADKKPTGKKKQRMLFQRDGKFFARDRFGVLGHHMDNPTVPRITELITPKLSQADDSGSAEVTPIRRRRRRPTAS
jgi:hypothetical protein